MDPEEQKQVLELLDVRVTILDSGSRSAPARVRVEGTVFEHALLQGIAPEVEDRWVWDVTLSSERTSGGS
jgi:hypothetical protein